MIDLLKITSTEEEFTVPAFRDGNHAGIVLTPSKIPSESGYRLMALTGAFATTNGEIFQAGFMPMAPYSIRAKNLTENADTRPWKLYWLFVKDKESI